MIHTITSFQYRGKTPSCSIRTPVSFSQEFHSLRLISYRTQKAKLNLGLPKGFTDFFPLFWCRVLCAALILCNFFFFFCPAMIAKKLIMTAGVVNACRCCLLPVATALVATALRASKRRSLHLYQQIVSKSSSCFVLRFNRSGSFLSFRRV